ncbi:MAG: nucleotidyltransferase family protein [Clostridia bacterium]|nr:nucleotidyltransferase family protein [Clostridia bacterium]
MILKTLFLLIVSEIDGKLLSEEVKANISDDMLQQLYNISKKHEIANLVASALEKNGLLNSESEVAAKFKKAAMAAVLNYSRQKYELSAVSELFEKEKLPFIPLKGSVIRDYYPQPHLRSSCDVDILVHHKDLDRATDLLCENFGYEKKSMGAHDISMYSPGKVHVELHFDLVEDGRVNSAAKVLGTAWDTALSAKNCRYHMEMTKEMFCVYHIAHMAKHMGNGGCGIRPFIDLYILKTKFGYDEERLLALLETAGLRKFYDGVSDLCNVWMNGSSHNATTETLEKYIVNGGVFGTVSTYVAAKQQKKQNKFKYFLSRMFLPYSIMKYKYPYVEKHKWLLPVAQISRWYGILFKRKKIERTMVEMKAMREIDDHTINTVRNLWTQLGL